jgi:hypothetical protein
MAASAQSAFAQAAQGGAQATTAVRNVAAQVGQLGSALQSVGTTLTASLTVPLAALGVASTKSAISIDKQVNVLKAFTGSAANAEKRLAELIATAQKTPGLTTQLAATLDAQLRVANVAERTINNILPTIGRLNAVAPLGDPTQFANNLIQLVTQNFERADLKELVGRSPIAGELIKQVFNVDSPTNSEAIRAAAERMGIRTADQFFTALANAANNNPKLANVSESIGAQLDKLRDRVEVALRPLGLAIIEAITPLVNAVVPAIEALGKAFASLPQPVQATVVVLGGLAAAIGPLLFILGGLAQTIVSLSAAWGVLQGALAAGGALAALPALLNPVTLAIVGVTAALGLGALAWANYETATERAAKISSGQLASQQQQIDQLKRLQAEARTLAAAQGNSAEQHAKLQSILAQLDPDTRTYIQSIGDQKLAMEELNRVLREQLLLKQGELNKNLEDIGNAALELEDKITRGTVALKVFKDESERFAQGQRVSFSEQIERTRLGLDKLPQSAQEFGAAITKTKGDVEGAKTALANLGAQVSAYVRQSGLVQKDAAKTIEAFRQQQLSFGRTEEEVNGMIAAYKAYQVSQENAAKASGGIVAGANQASDALAVLRRHAQDATAAVDELFSKGDSSSLRKTIKDRIGQIAAEAAKFNDAPKRAVEALNQALKDPKDSLNELIKLQQRFDTAERALNERVSPQRRTGGGASRRIAAEHRAEASAELKFLQQQEKERELSARRATEQLRRALDDRLLDIETYTNRAIAIDQELLQARLATLKEEEDAAVRSAKNKADADAKRHEVQLRAQQAILDSELRQEELRRQRREAEERAAEDHARKLAEIREVARRAEEDAIRDAVSQGRLSASDGEQRLLDLERERFEERKRLLQEEFILARNNLQERQRVNDELAKLAAEREAFEVGASRRIRDAQREEAAAFRDFIGARVDALVRLRRSEIDAQAAQTALALQRGQVAQRDAEAEAINQRIELLRIESAERVRQIEAESEALRRRAQEAGVLALNEVSIERQKTDAILAEKRRLAAEEQALREQQRATELTPGFGEAAAGAIAGIEAALGRMLTLWEMNRVALASYTNDLLIASQDAWSRATNVMGVFTDAVSASIDAFVQSGGSLKAAGKAIAKALAQPFIDAAKTRAQYHAAAAIASLAAFDIRGALLHGLAAAGFAALAGVGSALLNGGGGSASSGSLSGGGRSGAAGDTGPRVINQNTPTNQQQPITIVIRAETEEGVIVRRVVDDFRNNGATRQALRRDLLNE